MQERRQTGILGKMSRYFNDILPIVIVVGMLITVIITFAKINPLCDTVEKELKPDVRNLQIKMAGYDEKINNIDKNIAEIKEILKRGR
jgi:hypothetical protein